MAAGATATAGLTGRQRSSEGHGIASEELTMVAGSKPSIAAAVSATCAATRWHWRISCVAALSAAAADLASRRTIRPTVAFCLRGGSLQHHPLQAVARRGTGCAP